MSPECLTCPPHPPLYPVGNVLMCPPFPPLSPPSELLDVYRAKLLEVQQLVLGGKQAPVLSRLQV